MHIYVAHNELEHGPDVFKVGFAAEVSGPKSRMLTLSGAGNLGTFDHKASWDLGPVSRQAARQAETAVFARLQFLGLRVKDSREFFRAPEGKVDLLIQEVERIIEAIIGTTSHRTVELGLPVALEAVEHPEPDNPKDLLAGIPITTSRFLALCGIPLRPTDDSVVTRSATLANRQSARVTYSRGRSGLPLPFGRDRATLAWLITMAREKQNRRVVFRSGGLFGKFFGLRPSGQNYNRFLYGIERIAAMECVIQVQNEDGTGHSLGLIEQCVALPGNEHVVIFSEEFFQDFVQSPVVMDYDLTKGLANNPTLWDLVQHLAYLSSIKRSEPTVIMIGDLCRQVESVDKNPRKVQMKLRRLLESSGSALPYIRFDPKIRGERSQIVIAAPEPGKRTRRVLAGPDYRRPSA